MLDFKVLFAKHCWITIISYCYHSIIMIIPYVVITLRGHQITRTNSSNALFYFFYWNFKEISSFSFISVQTLNLSLYGNTMYSKEALIISMIGNRESTVFVCLADDECRIQRPILHHHFIVIFINYPFGLDCETHCVRLSCGCSEL